MIATIRSLVKRTFVYDIVTAVRVHRTRELQELEIREWQANAEPVPPPHIVKQRTLEQYAKTFSLKTLIETGTYQGDMVEAMKDVFNTIYSIELDGELYRRAKERFSSMDHISIIHGDSGKVLPEVLAKLKEPCLFWLDGHYSAGITAKGDADTPINEELDHILNHPVAGHVILIDDARLFVGEDHYPKIDELKDSILRRDPDQVFEVRHDIVRIHRKYSQ